MKAAKRQRSPSADSSSNVPGSECTSLAIFLFRRDFRIIDNTALTMLYEAVRSKNIKILPLFIFNPDQAEAKKNPYFSNASFAFLLQSLIDLNGSEQLSGKLVCTRGTDKECLALFQKSGYKIEFLAFNEDYTPFARARDKDLYEWCQKNNVCCVTSKLDTLPKATDSSDYTLLPLKTALNGSGNPYAVYTPYSNRILQDYAKQIRPADTTAIDVNTHFISKKSLKLSTDFFVDPEKLLSNIDHYKGKGSTSQLLLYDKGGRKIGLELLGRIKSLKNYAEERNSIPEDKTTHLSPHLKFGTVSIREVWSESVRCLGYGHAFIRQLVWREFYSMLVFHHPHLLHGQLAQKGGKPVKVMENLPFQKKYYNFLWSWDKVHLERFKQGLTGFPLVDASVRCVTATGWCHNRSRMLIANFLTKVLGVDWRQGERWFASVAVDYDPANNSGGWLWASGQGADAQPYFRLFNPFRQSERFDPSATFIKKWVPELTSVPPSVIHAWDTYCEKQQKAQKKSSSDTNKSTGKNKSKASELDAAYPTSYPAPMVDFRSATKKIIEEFKKYDPIK